MRPEEYHYLYELEAQHWWFVGMRKVVTALLEGAVSGAQPRMLDAGCGTGLMMAWLRRFANAPMVFGLDYDSSAVRYTSGRGEQRVVLASVAAMPFPSDSFDLVTTFDVLDSFAVSEAPKPFGELSRVLRPGGVLLVRVPALQVLYSQHDRAVSTEHRYTAGELRSRLEEQGLRVERATYANFLLFPVVVVWRWLTRSSRPDPRSDVRPLPKLVRWLNSILPSLFSIEAAWLRYLPFRLPFGVSVIALARKPSAGDSKRR